MTRIRAVYWPLIGVVLLASLDVCHAYSVLTHEEVVDLLWKDDIEPLLVERFPDATPEELKKAHAFVYGGALIQDMGYYPFGNKYFSDLTHYVRSGDFVVNMIHEASNLNEYAFALGTLAHYSSDIIGHPSINKAVAIQLPNLRKKYGDEVTYEDNPKAHIRTEFGFDMTQVAKNRYTSDRYHDFIGFEVSKPVLERAFQDTYGIPLSDVISNEDLAIGTFRRAISKIIPEMTRVALIAHKKELAQTPNFTSRKFRYYLSKAKYQQEWGKGYEKPGFGAEAMAFFLRFVPKVGPFRALDFKIPNRQTEALYIASVGHALDNYRGLLTEVKQNQLQLRNIDFDTGKPTRRGEYALSDDAYAHLLDQLATKNFQEVTPPLRQNILDFYADQNAPATAKRDRATGSKTDTQVGRLKNTVPEEVELPIDNLP